MTRIAHSRSAAAQTSARAATLLAIGLTSLQAHAVIVRGSVRDPLGRAIPGAHVELIAGKQVAASTTTLPDGTFEIRSTEQGRFLLLANAPGFAISIGDDFYGGQLDVVSRDLQMTISPVREEVTVTATGLPTPVQQISSSVSTIADRQLATTVNILNDLRLQPGVALVSSGQYGGVTSLFIRGAESTSSKILIDDVPANDIGGVFDFGTVSSTAVHALETERGPNSIFNGTDARAGVLRFETPRGTAIRPVLTYSGDAGNLHTWRNEATLSGAYNKVDYYTAFSRFDSSNTLANDRYHAATSAANIGYNLTANTSVRGTVRNAVSAVGLPGPFYFQGLTLIGKQGDQDTYISGLIDDTRRNNWHNAFRYIGARKREQSQNFLPVGTPDGFGGYIGNTVTIRGANGTVATGQSYVDYDPLPSRYEQVSSRDGRDYRTDYRFGQHLTALGGFRFQDERGLYRTSFSNLTVDRSNYDYTLAFQGSAANRFFYTLGGAIQHNSLYGTQGQPQLGLAAYVVRPGRGWLHGTRLSAHFSKGTQEPNLISQAQSLYTELLGIGDTAGIAAFRIRPIGAQHSRTYEGGLQQNIYSDRAVLKLTYFHSTYDRGIEYVYTTDYNGYFHQSLPVALGFGFYLNSLATRSQGLEANLEYQVLPRLMLNAGYTYTDSTVLQSFATDAINALGGSPVINPNYPGIAIGAFSPLVGQRPFRRPPQTGYVNLSYAGVKWSAALKGAVSSKSDDSTFIDEFTSASFDNSMLLPNRNLNYGWTKLDANLTYQLKPSLAVFTQLDNVLNNQHIAAFGYPSLPFTFRAGLKLRFPHE